MIFRRFTKLKYVNSADIYEMRSRGQKHLIGALICVGFRNTTKSKSKLTLKLPLQIYVINT